MNATIERANPAPGRRIAVLGLVAAVASLLLAPVVLGPVAVVLGVVSYLKGERLGLVALGAGVVLGSASLLVALSTYEGF